MTGTRPTGFRAPCWTFSPSTLDILRDIGFRCESSLMADDARGGGGVRAARGAARGTGAAALTRGRLRGPRLDRRDGRVYNRA